MQGEAQSFLRANALRAFVEANSGHPYVGIVAVAARDGVQRAAFSSWEVVSAAKSVIVICWPAGPAQNQSVGIGDEDRAVSTVSNVASSMLRGRCGVAPKAPAKDANRRTEVAGRRRVGFTRRQVAVRAPRSRI
jgi:hypothetical protein